MALNFSVLKKKGLTNERLKAIFTSVPPEGQTQGPVRYMFRVKDEAFAAHADPTSGLFQLPANPTDWDLRQFFEQRIWMRLQEAWQRTFDSYRLYAAVDIAMDSTPINQYNWPLMMLAQGHIDLSTAHNEIKSLSPGLADQLFSVKKENGVPFKVNLPKFCEVSYNLVHSLTTRRVAAVSTPIATRFPFMKYDSRSTAMAGKLRAELMTQRAEIMSDQYGYRHDIVQSVRDVSCYSHQVEFCRSSWDTQKQTLMVDKPRDGATGAGAAETDQEQKEVITREGVDFIAPHPSRVFYDLAYPLGKINTEMRFVAVGII